VFAGLASATAPLVRVIDSMYAGQIVMKQYADAYGLDWTKWHPDVFESVQRRHEALIADIEQHVAPNVPEGAFFPLGIKSQVLLTGQPVIVDAEALAEVKEHAVAKAEAAWAAAQREKEAELAGHGAHSCLSLYFSHAAGSQLLTLGPTVGSSLRTSNVVHELSTGSESLRAKGSGHACCSTVGRGRGGGSWRGD
jgi:hypothetical protein